MAQVNHYLAVSGFDCWYVVALIFGRELVIHKIVTDKQVLSDLIDKEELFWTNHVVPQIPLHPTVVIVTPNRSTRCMRWTTGTRPLT